uniref:Desmoglein 2 n=1 Tax=Cyprinus carpio TaxID=7962 RepID=A0A8C1PAY0_CYPCA
MRTFQNSVALHRQKREWIVPPQILEENVDYTKREFIAKIRSDREDIQLKNVRYSLKGIGADQNPFNLFVVNPETGYVRITGLLDREQIAQYNLSGIATFRDGTIAENDIGLRIKVKDQNDNKPVFGPMEPGNVYELSPVDTSVMKINCFDADEVGNPNSQIKYEIVEQQPAGEQMFRVDHDGTVRVINPKLDRETIDQYVLLVRASDLNGAPGGNEATGTVIIQINDVNDNVPVLQGPFEATVDENTEKIEVMRLKAKDLDLENTDNWVTNCFIASGNEAGYFSIHTDPKTNDAAVDYEDVKDLNLGIGVKNIAPFHPSMYNVKIKVRNQPEGPKFIPLTKAIPISEGKTFNSNEVIAKYPATDTDTGKEATNVKYVKGFDPDNWLTIDEKTGAIKMNKAPDRESKFLANGTYYAHIYSITQDLPSKTATGTIAIQVEDFNDHCPTLASKVKTLCTEKDAVLVTAVDEDAPPNGSPFTFNVVPEGTKGKWTVEYFNDTTAIFRTHEKLWPGEYELTVDVKDQQGLSCPEPQKIQVEVCTCTDQGACSRTEENGSKGTFKKGSRFGPAGIGLLFLGLLSLLLIPLLLLLCQCGAAGMTGTFTDMPFDTKEHLISYHTEGQGEDRDVPLLDVVDGRKLSFMSKDGVGGMYFAGGAGGALGAGGAGFLDSTSTMGGRGYNEMEMSYMDSIRRSDTLRSRGGAGDFDGMAVSDMFLGEYYSQVSIYCTHRKVSVAYDYEGKGSPVGSVGCCSILEDNNDLEFLNDLGPKFTTLAEICGGKKTEVSAPLPPPPKPIVDRTEVSSSTNVINSGNIATNSAVSSNTLNTASNTAITSSTRVENFLVTDNRPTVITSVQPAPTVLMQPQPMYYMVESQPSTVLLTESPAMGQSMYVLNSSPVTEGVIVQGGNIATNTLTRGERMVLVDRGAPAQAGMLHTGNLSGSQVLLVDGGATSGHVLQGGQVLQGTLQRGFAGSQGLMVVEGQGGQLIQGTLKKGVSTHGGSQNVLYVESKGGSAVSQGGLQKGTAGSVGSVGFGGASVQINQNPQIVQERKVVTTQSIK